MVEVYMAAWMSQNVQMTKYYYSSKYFYNASIKSTRPPVKKFYHMNTWAHAYICNHAHTRVHALTYTEYTTYKHSS